MCISSVLSGLEGLWCGNIGIREEKPAQTRPEAIGSK